MGKNLKKVIFSVLLLAAVIVVSPKDAKAAGKVKLRNLLPKKELIL